MDIFEDVRKELGCDYISDLRYEQTAAKEALKRMDMNKYSPTPQGRKPRLL